nr:MAG TPA: hypothetical protein [Caudoviricetes sp.]DAN63486.1 MAG TPA: hypothetical protein [Caudoviricetes sp.]
MTYQKTISKTRIILKKEIIVFSSCKISKSKNNYLLWLYIQKSS